MLRHWGGGCLLRTSATRPQDARKLLVELADAVPPRGASRRQARRGPSSSAETLFSPLTRWHAIQGCRGRHPVPRQRATCVSHPSRYGAQHCLLSNKCWSGVAGAALHSAVFERPGCYPSPARWDADNKCALDPNPWRSSAEACQLPLSHLLRRLRGRLILPWGVLSLSSGEHDQGNKNDESPPWWASPQVLLCGAEGNEVVVRHGPPQRHLWCP